MIILVLHPGDYQVIEKIGTKKLYRWHEDQFRLPYGSHIPHGFKILKDSVNPETGLLKDQYWALPRYRGENR